MSLDVLLVDFGESTSIRGLGPHLTLDLNVYCRLVEASDGAICRRHVSWSTCFSFDDHVVFGLVDCPDVKRTLQVLSTFRADLTAACWDNLVLVQSHALNFGFECTAIKFFSCFFPPHHFEFVLAPHVPQLLRFVHALQGRLFLCISGSCFLVVSIGYVLNSCDTLLTSLNIGRSIFRCAPVLFCRAIFYLVEPHLIFDSLDKEVFQGVVKLLFARVTHIFKIINRFQT